MLQIQMLGISTTSSQISIGFQMFYISCKNYLKMTVFFEILYLIFPGANQ